MDDDNENPTEVMWDTNCEVALIYAAERIVNGTVSRLLRDAAEAYLIRLMGKAERDDEE